MKKFLISGVLFTLIIGNICAASADCGKGRYNVETDLRCTELMEKIRSEKNTLDNVLSLSKEQREIKTELDKQRNAELDNPRKIYRAEKQKLRELAKSDCSYQEFKSQQKVVKKARKQIRKIHKKYDKKFVKILCPLQRSKYREVIKLTRKEIRYCKLNKKACPKDPYVNTFGKQDAKEHCEVCKKHQAHHILNHKCDTCD